MNLKKKSQLMESNLGKMVIAVIIIIVAIGIVMYFRRGTGGVLSNLLEKLRFGGG